MTSGFLTTQQVQDLLDVDASTIYRMAGDGRLPAVRIGRQWRFPAADIEAMLRPGGTAPHASAPHASAPHASAPVGDPASGPAPTGADPALPATQGPPRTAGRSLATSTPHDAAPLSPELATATLEAVAPALGVSMVVTDLAGQPLTPIVNPAPAIVARSQDPDFGTACATEWRGFAHEPHLAPRFQPGRFGFLCAHSFVRQGTSLVAMVLAGGIAPVGSDDPELFHLDADRHAVVLETLPRTAALLSRLVAPTDDS
ncbi:MAG: helix-turn-helix domain-containing protein [Nitriliruptor sp.]|nr:MAG: helix-turn-helix domain-containing protein [Nitriliruptor sp.]